MPRRSPPSATVAPSTTALPGLVLAALAAAFVLSGAAGLIYESIWSRYLGLFVGHSAYAQIIVLVIFMGGMAAGALLVGRRSERIAHPLLAYAAVEIAVGVLGLVFHSGYVALTRLAYDSWFPALGSGAALAAIKWGLAGALILPQSVLLGATFPLMAAGVVRQLPQSPGRVVALLYFANSLGAAAGVLASGFWLIEIGGLPGTLATAALLNLLVAALVIAIARRRAPRSAQPGAAHRAAAEPWRAKAAEGSEKEWLLRLLIAVSFGTAAASFIYEIAWIRMLSLVLGSATHSFELMLSAFIIGLALGAAWIHRRADRIRDPLKLLGWTQWVMGVLALATLPLYMASFEWMSSLVTGLRTQPQGYATFGLARYGICLAVMLPATFCAGITLPLLTRILMTRGRGEQAIGAVYGANTLGSIAGAALAGLVLLPWLGVERLLAAGAALDIALGVALLAVAVPEKTPRRLVLAAAAAGLVLVAGVMGMVRLDRLRLASGVFRAGNLFKRGDSEVVFYRDGRTATVSVRRQPAGDLTLSTNGKPDASLPGRWLDPDSARVPVPLTDDESTQILLGVMTLAHAPAAKQGAVIGIGSGVTSHVLLGSPRLSRLLTIEIEPEMIEAARLFRPANRRVFDDPRSAFAVDDARSYFAASRERFDLIVSEPSNPWVSGVSGLFTDQFYGRVREALTEHGVLGQWLHLYDLDDDLVLSVLAAVGRNFKTFEIHFVSGSDILIVATNSPKGLAPDWSVARDPGIAEVLARTLPFNDALFDATWITDRASLDPLLKLARVNSDFQPVLDLGAERSRFRLEFASGLIMLHFDRFCFAAASAPRVGPLDGDQVPLPMVMRVNGLSWVARFRAALGGEPPRPGEEPQIRERLAAAVARMQRVLGPSRTGEPPPDWKAWLVDAIMAEDDLHRGTTRYANDGYFELLRRGARRAGAPAPIAQAIDWVQALERRELARASVLTDSLLAEHEAGRPVIFPELLLDGGTMAKLSVGDPVGARRILAAIRPGFQRPMDDLRVRLVEAHIAASRP